MFILGKSPEPQSVRMSVDTRHSSHLFDPELFSQAKEKSTPYIRVSQAKVRGGIIPHHLVASPLISGFFQGIQTQPVDTIILLSPNHHGIGPHDIVTSERGWSTIFGNLDVNKDTVKQLQKNGLVQVYEEVFDTEHGIYGITPFIKQAFPTATIVPLVVRGGITKDTAYALAEEIAALSDESTLVLVSSDFSHYLPSEEADSHDKNTIAALTVFDTGAVWAFDDTTDSDSPHSLYILLRVMEKLDATHMDLIANTNSAKITGHPEEQRTTSYVTAYFTKKTAKTEIPTMYTYEDPTRISKIKPDSSQFSIIATGDVIPARSVNALVVNANDFVLPFKQTAGFLHTADTVFINLESPLVAGCKTTTEGMSFCGDQRFIQGLTYAGVSVASIANNHAGNYGIDGVRQTVQLLRENRILVTGNGEAAVQTVKGKRIGFLGYNTIGHKEEGIAWADPVVLDREIRSLRRNVDVLVVAFHWGVEYVSTPNSAQIDLAHAAVDAGADLVIGNHPHWVQGVEQYKGKFITYAHGNYIFDQMWSQETREGVLGRYTFTGTTLTDVNFFPIIIDSYGVARFASPSESGRILDRMNTSTEQIKRSR